MRLCCCYCNATLHHDHHEAVYYGGNRVKRFCDEQCKSDYYITDTRLTASLEKFKDTPHRSWQASPVVQGTLEEADDGA